MTTSTAKRYPSCTGGSCIQGRAKCETPEACGVALPEEATDSVMVDIGSAIAVVAICAISGLALAVACAPK